MFPWFDPAELEHCLNDDLTSCFAGDVLVGYSDDLIYVRDQKDAKAASQRDCHDYWMNDTMAVGTRPPAFLIEVWCRSSSWSCFRYQ